MSEQTYGSFSLTVYCKCGGSMKGSGAGEMAAVAELQAAWWQIHDGEGHGPATQKEAARARRKVENAYYREIGV